MKLQLYGLDVSYILKELEILKTGKVVKIIQPSKSSFIFRFFTKQGNRVLHLNIPKALYLSDKTTIVEKVPQFCQALRNHFINTILLDIEQRGLERILIFTFKTKDGIKKIILELFSRGNLIVCEEDYTILLPLSSQIWKHRAVKKGATYIFPAEKQNPFILNKQEFSALIRSSNKENIVKALAIECSLGGRYAEEICSLAHIDKDAKQTKLSQTQLDSLFNHMMSLQDRPLKPQLVYEGDALVDVTPFKLTIHDTTKATKTYSVAIEQGLGAQEQFSSKFEKKIAQTKKILRSLEKNINLLEQRSVTNKQKAELLYEHYEEIMKILTFINEKKKEIPLQKLQKTLKEHPIVKEIIPKKQGIVVDL